MEPMVDIGSLRVYIVLDGEGYFAQGLEVDYAAEGSTIADVQQRFELGLQATLAEFTKRHGSSEGYLFTLTKLVTWQEFFRALLSRRIKFLGSRAAFLSIKDFPFSSITYYQIF